MVCDFVLACIEIQSIKFYCFKFFTVLACLIVEDIMQKREMVLGFVSIFV